VAGEAIIDPGEVGDVVRDPVDPDRAGSGVQHRPLERRGDRACTRLT